jgi:hypothetical protein
LALVAISVGVIAVVALNRDGVLLGEPRGLSEMNPEGSTNVPLPPGRYVTEVFEPALSFAIDKGVGWWLLFPEAFDNFELTTAKPSRHYYSELGFFRVHEVYTPNGQAFILPGSNDRTASAPDDMVTWLRNHPLLDTSKPVPLTVGGKEAVRLDVSVSTALEAYSPACGSDPCVYLLGIADKSEYNGLALWANDKNRLIVLEDVEGESVVIAIVIPTQFEGFLPKAQKVLDTVKWENSP